MAKKKNDIDSKVEDYFAANPKAKRVYSTTDGYLFTSKKFASDHEATLETDEEPKLHKNAGIPDTDEEQTEEPENEETE